MKQIGLTIHQCQLPDESVHACHSQQSMGPYKIAHYLLVNELSKLFRKANVLYWAKSLLNLTYDFINHCIASSFEPPPLSIPWVHFVEAGLALDYYRGGSKPGSKTGSTCAVFLLEEFIDNDREDFVKFIHNMDANPLIDYNDYDYDLVVFFAFTQHVQYVKTGKLTSISEGCDIFGDRNTKMTVSQFEKDHIYNKYCEWPVFGLEAYVGRAESETSK